MVECLMPMIPYLLGHLELSISPSPKINNLDGVA